MLPVLALIFAAACGSSGGGEPTTGITGPGGPLVMGLSRQYSVDFPGVSAGSVTWYLTDPEAGTITSTGLFTAGAKAGTFAIVATAIADADITDTLQVTVIPYALGTPLGMAAYGVAVSSTGLIAAADNNATVRIRNGATTSSVITGSTPVHLAFSPDGGQLFVTSMGFKLFRITVANGAIVDTADFGRAVYNIAIRPTDSLVYVSTSDGWIYKVAPATLEVVDSVELASASNGLAFGPGGTVLWASTIDAGVLYKLDPATLAKTDSMVLGLGLQRLAVAPSGDSVYVGNQNTNEIFIVRASTGDISSVSLAGSPHGVGITSDGTRLFVATLSGTVSVYSRSTMTFLGSLPLPGSGRTVAAGAGNVMFVSTENNVVRID